MNASPVTPPGAAMSGPMRRNLLLLACCQAIGQACNTMMFSATGLSVVTFFAHPDLATLPMTVQHIGVMAWVFPASLLMQRVGRSLGFRAGSLFGMTGGTVVAYGLYTTSFAAMCIGAFILGYAVACLQMYRFAAAELVPPALRPKAISWVTAGGVAAAMLGPSMVRWTHDHWVPLYIGTYVAMIGMHLVVFLVMSCIRFPAIQEVNTAAAAVPAALPPCRRLCRRGRCRRSPASRASSPRWWPA